MQLLGIFGGTFDPVHCGHLQAVGVLQAELQFAQIHWVLSARPPHKYSTSASIEARYEMLELALSPVREFIPSDIEIRRDNESYTIDTVSEFQTLYPEHKICLIIGVDSLAKLPSWYRYRELIDLASFVVMARPGYDISVPLELQDRLVSSAQEIRAAKSHTLMILKQTDFDVSSTQIRALLRETDSQSQKAVQKLLPSSVYDYIQQHQSYTLAPMQPEQIKDHVIDALENIKGKDIRVIEIADISDFADYMVVVSGTSDTHVKALAREASDNLRRLGVKPLNEDGADLGEWVLVDFGDVVLHVMRPEVRDYYDLEKLWDEDVRELLKQHREEQDS
jgi:nicotinate-nucleotide adenylyltransferase